MRLSALVIPGVLAATLVVGAQSALATTTSLVTLDKGHVDVVDVEYADGALELHVHDETVEPGVERDPADVLFRVLPAAATTVPADPAYRFLGAAGATVRVLPQIQNEDLLWPGLSTEELTTGVFTGDQVSLAVTKVRGPGTVSVFTTNEFGAPTVLVNSGDGLPDTVALPVGDHLHANWGFTKPGVYRLTVQVTAKLPNGSVSSAPTVLTFCVK